MKLVSQGKLSLNEPITTYLPPSILSALSTPETAALLEHVTVRHLLSHTAGLTVHGFPGYDITHSPTSTPPSAEAILAGKEGVNTVQVRLAALPGQRFAYSGGGITILQVILCNITSLPFPTLMQELVLGPLGMTRSFYRTPGEQDNYAHAYYTGYTETEFPFRVQPEQAAAGLWTTPTDLLKAVRAMQDSVSAEDDSGFLPRDLAKQMLTEVMSGMALGWFSSSSPIDASAAPNSTSSSSPANNKATSDIAKPSDANLVLPAFQHAGGNVGFRCHVFGYLPVTKTSDTDFARPQGAGICIMTNSEEGYPVLRKLMHAIAYAKKWPTLRSAYGVKEVEIPFCASYPVASNTTATAKNHAKDDWKQWTGKWKGREQEYIIQETGNGVPEIVFQKLPGVRLRPAALPAVTDAEGRLCLDYVLEGLEIMIRMKWEGVEKVLEVWDGVKGTAFVLRRE